MEINQGDIKICVVLEDVITVDAIPDAEEGAAAAVQYAAMTAETLIPAVEIPIPAAETLTPAAAEILITEMASMTVFSAGYQSGFDAGIANCVMPLSGSASAGGCGCSSGTTASSFFDASASGGFY